MLENIIEQTSMMKTEEHSWHKVEENFQSGLDSKTKHQA